MGWWYVWGTEADCNRSEGEGVDSLTMCYVYEKGNVGGENFVILERMGVPIVDQYVSL